MRTRKWYPKATAATILFLVLALAGAAAAGCGQSAQAAGGTLELDEGDNGKSFIVEVGDTVQVSIAGNATTGYSWIEALDGASGRLLVLHGEPVYVEGVTDEQVVGAGGAYTFTFQAAAKGQATLALNYARAWESVPPIQTFAADITIE